MFIHTESAMLRMIGLLVFVWLIPLTVQANCAAPVEFALQQKTTWKEEVSVVAPYNNYQLPDTMLRAKIVNGTYSEIAEVTLSNNVDNCVQPGKYIYVDAGEFQCNNAACYCRNYAEITVANHNADCKQTGVPAKITAEDLKNMMRNESWYSNPDNGPDWEDEDPFDDDDVLPDEQDEDEIITDDSDEPVLTDDNDIGYDLNDNGNITTDGPVTDGKRDSDSTLDAALSSDADTAANNNDTSSNGANTRDSGCSLTIF